MRIVSGVRTAILFAVLTLSVAGCCQLRESGFDYDEESPPVWDGGEFCRSFLSSDSRFMAGAQVGVDGHKYRDAILLGVHGGWRQPLRRIPVGLALSVDLGVGSDDFDGRFRIIETVSGSGHETFGRSGDLDFNVLHVRSELLYPLVRMRRLPLAVYALAGPSFYQWTVTDCAGGDCRNSSFGLNVGGGVYYGILGLEAVTGISGDLQDVALRLKTTVPIGSRY